MNKKLLIVFVTMFLLVFSVKAFATSPIDNITNEQHDALIIGEMIKNEDAQITLKILDIIDEELEKETSENAIKIDNEITLTNVKTNLKENTIVLASLTRSDKGYICNGRLYQLDVADRSVAKIINCSDELLTSSIEEYLRNKNDDNNEIEFVDETQVDDEDVPTSQLNTLISVENSAALRDEISLDNSISYTANSNTGWILVISTFLALLFIIAFKYIRNRRLE